MSKKLVVANWKLNPSSIQEAERIVKGLGAKKWKNLEVVICPPSVFLSKLSLKKGPASFGVQSVFYESVGSFTGEISAGMARSVGASFVIVGHSERRAMGENNVDVSKRVFAGLKVGLKVILCVGEKERDIHGHYLSYLKAQIDESLAHISKVQAKSLVLAYEPLFAIGEKSNGAMEPEDLRQSILFVRKVLHGRFGKAAFSIPIIYGGSVDHLNAGELVKEGGVDGLLVGRESLRPEGFLKIITSVENLK